MNKKSFGGGRGQGAGSVGSVGSVGGLSINYQLPTVNHQPSFTNAITINPKKMLAKRHYVPLTNDVYINPHNIDTTIRLLIIFCTQA
ncbi:MAG: hypothetical protein QNJ36_22295 [Calothrix sp. MO_167.B42]|nr:hypothetical protein [Calothrix sp. MO_167.B42]